MAEPERCGVGAAVTELNSVPQPDPHLVGLLRADLQAANWTVDTVDELLGETASAALAREQRVPGLVQLRGNPTPAALLTRAFILGEPTDLSAAFPSLTLAGATRLGLVGAGNAPLVDLRPHAATLPAGDFAWWIASDLSESQTGKPLLLDHVLGIGPATLSLLRMTIRDPVESALDLGTGCGIQALYLTTHARHVVATDLSERACAFTRFNALLNQANIDVRLGSLFEPVRGERFDLVTSNPPFVITPDSLRTGGVHQYRDGGMDRDDLIKLVVTEGPTHLTPAGTLQMLLNWEQPTTRPWNTRVQNWLEAATQNVNPDGLDAWLVQRDRLDPARYAELWLRDSGGNLLDRATWEADYERWMSGFQRAGVTEIGMGFLAVKRTDTGKLRLQADDIADGEFPDGKTLTGALQNVELPDGWQDLSLIRAEDVRERRHYRPGTPDPQVVELTQGGGMGRTIQVSSTAAAVVGAADGELTISQVAVAISVLTDTSEKEIWTQLETELPQLLRMGIVTIGSE